MCSYECEECTSGSAEECWEFEAFGIDVKTDSVAIKCVFKEVK